MVSIITHWILPIAEAVAMIAFGLRQLYLAKYVDQLESSAKLSAAGATRIRNRPLKLAGWLLIFGGIGLFVIQVFGF